MVKAIVHLETTQGWYDSSLELLGLNKTIRPMNINYEYWKELGFTRKDIEDPEKNIQLGVELLKRIQDRMPNANSAEVATIYNNLGARNISNYGARVDRLMKEKPWNE